MSDATTEQAQAMLDELLSFALYGIESAEKRSAGDLRRFRRLLFGGMRKAICDIHRETSTRRLSDAVLGPEEKSVEQNLASVMYLYTLALIELARGDNTQWDDVTLFAGQLKYHVRIQCLSGDVIDPKSGKYVIGGSS